MGGSPSITTWENNVHPFSSLKNITFKHTRIKVGQGESFEKITLGNPRNPQALHGVLHARTGWSEPRCRLGQHLTWTATKHGWEISEFNAWPFWKEQADSWNPKKEQLWKIHMIHAFKKIVIHWTSCPGTDSCITAHLFGGVTGRSGKQAQALQPWSMFLGASFCPPFHNVSHGFCLKDYPR